MYKQISPATDLYFVFSDVIEKKPVVMPIAAFALVDDGSAVIGLIGEVSGGGPNLESSSHKRIARLVSVPPIEGAYKHISALSPAELASLARTQ